MKMTYTFDSIAGYTQEKKELMALCNLFNNRKEFEKKGARLPKGIIFYGDIGNGKTLFAKVLASECGLNTINIDLSESINAYDICKQIKNAFNSGKQNNSPTMIFFDELDKVVPNESDFSHTDREKTILSQLLTLIDGMDSGSNIIFVATCNDYDCIPQALVRPGRIDKKIGIHLPDYESRKAILKMYIDKSACKFNIKIDELSKLCANLSSASLETLINECIIATDKNNLVSENLIKAKIREIKQEDIVRRIPRATDRLFACNNLGSFVVAKSFNSGDYTLSTYHSTVCNNYFDTILHFFDSDYGRCDYGDDDDNYDDDYDDDYFNKKKGFYSKNAYIYTITTILGGYAAENLIFQKTYDNNDWQFSLIHKILKKMSKNGMFGLDKVHFDPFGEIYPSSRLEKIVDEFYCVINDCYKKANDIVAKNVELIKKLMPVVVEKGTIRKNEAEVLIEKFGGIN